ncbi:MAG: TolC family protein [Nitrospira sp.]|nr:TolC family protein [Nitrospira sp.]
MTRLVLIVFVLLGLLVGQAPVPAGAAPDEPKTARPLPPIPLSLNEVLAWVDRSHPLLKGAGTEKIAARGKLLKALGAFEPVLGNALEVERFTPSAQAQAGIRNTQTAGFNDTFLEMLHPSGFKGLAGFRQGFGTTAITVPDLSLGNGGQLLMGASMPLLRGFMVNPENAELQRSGLADPRAEIEIAQTRQDLFLAAAGQYWDWVAAWKLVDVQQRALKVAEDRFKQIEERAKTGLSAPLDAVEANQEVQRRREILIAATRGVEQEQYKLSLFLWENGAPMAPAGRRVPDFQKPVPLPMPEAVKADRLAARARRPEVLAVGVEAKINNIDLELAKNNLLPSLDLTAQPVRQPQQYVLGLGYSGEAVLRIPFLQRKARGEVLEAQGKADRLVLTQLFREQQVLVDVDNALSAVERAKQRIDAAQQSLQLAKTLEEGERFRFGLGATSVLFVNLRERLAVDSENQYLRALADYQKALALYQWAIGAWSPVNASATMPVTYRPMSQP